jgi:N-acetylgalactosamine-6-sulfatase
MVERIDHGVGMILAELEKNSLADNTLVVFSSDNGPESTGGEKDKGSPGKLGTYYSVGETGGLRGRKRSLFEGGVRVPFIVRWPGHAPAGLKNDTTVFSAVDLLPTFCAAAGVTLPPEAAGDGENLLAAFNGERVRRNRPIFWLHTGANAEPDWWQRLAVREGNWKLVMTYGAARVELHDLSSDRAEDAERDESKTHPEIVARLSKLALDWQATLPTKADSSCVSKERSEQPKSATKEDTSKPGTTQRTTPEQRAKAFARWDTNHDDQLTLDEYKAGLKGQDDLDARFKRFDHNGDAKLTGEEFTKPTAK